MLGQWDEQSFGQSADALVAIPVGHGPWQHSTQTLVCQIVRAGICVAQRERLARRGEGRERVIGIITWSQRVDKAWRSLLNFNSDWGEKTDRLEPARGGGFRFRFWLVLASCGAHGPGCKLRRFEMERMQLELELEEKS